MIWIATIVAPTGVPAKIEARMPEYFRYTFFCPSFMTEGTSPAMIFVSSLEYKSSLEW